VSTEWIVLVSFIKYVATTTIKKEKKNVQVIRPTARRYFRERQHGPTWACIHKKRYKNARNHGNSTKRTSELRERAI